MSPPPGVRGAPASPRLSPSDAHLPSAVFCEGPGPAAMHSPGTGAALSSDPTLGSCSVDRALGDITAAPGPGGPSAVTGSARCLRPARAPAGTQARPYSGDELLRPRRRGDRRAFSPVVWYTMQGFDVLTFPVLRTAADPSKDPARSDRTPLTWTRSIRGSRFGGRTPDRARARPSPRTIETGRAQPGTAAPGVKRGEPVGTVL